MTPYRPPGYPAFLGDLAYAFALILFVFLQRVALRLREEESNAWWASNGRDVVNGLAVVAVSSGIWLQGVAAHLALAFGASLTLALSAFHSYLQRRRRDSWSIIFLAAVVLGAPLILAPRPLAEIAERVLLLAFPR